MVILEQLRSALKTLSQNQLREDLIRQLHLRDVSVLARFDVEVGISFGG